jgi:hypothetical protein
VFFHFNLMLRRRTAGEMSSTTAASTSNHSTSTMAPAERKATEKSNMATASIDGDDCIGAPLSTLRLNQL